VETGELLFEKRSHEWTLTKFALEVTDTLDNGAVSGKSGNSAT